MGTDRRKRLLVVVAAICVGGWVADNLVFTPLFNVWKDRAARVEELQQEIAKSADLMAREADLRARWEDMKKRALPKRGSDAEKAVFESVSQWSADSNLTVTSLKPHWGRVDKESQGLEIQLDGTGNMEAVAKFIYNLEKSPLPLKVDDLAIISQDNKGGHLNLTLRFTGIVLQDAAS